MSERRKKKSILLPDIENMRNNDQIEDVGRQIARTTPYLITGGHLLISEKSTLIYTRAKRVNIFINNNKFSLP